MADDIKRAGLIGVGPVSDWHIRALRLAGFDITAVSSRKKSTRVLPFAQKHKIPATYSDWETMLKDKSSFDALLIATHVEGTVDVLSVALELGLPILVEKPVALSSKQIETVCKKAHPLVQVGYNRRFYPSILFARQETQAREAAIANLFFPENISHKSAKAPYSYLYRFFQNSCHGTDMLRFIFGDLQIEKTKYLLRQDRKLWGFGALLSTARGDVVSFTANWGTPANLSLTIDWPGRRIELKPLERASVYEKMKIVEPSKDFPLRQYLPKIANQVGLSEIDLVEKPGFAEQARAFKRMVDTGKPFPLAATLQDAYCAVKLCEDLVERI